jgi:two-component system sensor histidine kinase MtrB
MTLTTSTEQVFSPRRNWRHWLSTMRASWRTSLSLRTLVITVALTSATILVILVGMALFVQNDLFDSRKEQVLDESRRAVAYAQTRLASAVVDGEGGALQELMLGAIDDIARISTSERIALFRIGAEGAPMVQVDVSTGGLTAGMLSEDLRTRVVLDPETQWWQSLELADPSTGMPVPGIVVGQQISVPEVGSYELYIAYDLTEPDQTLSFVQGTLWFAGFLLVAIIGAIAWIVLRSVSAPIVEAAETSARLAAGDLAVRLQVQGEDELAVLGRSFNAMADSIESQIKELGELSLVQQRFVSDVSHELRTPLTTIRLAADMLNSQRETFDQTTARTAELLHTQVERFEQLLGDLLEISRYDAGSVQLELEPISLVQVAGDVIEQLMPLAADRGCELRLVAPGGYALVDLDARRVRRILRNLIGNAIEHGEGRPIVITVDSNERAVAAGVRDFGSGMSAEAMERVFDRFWRADPSRQRTLGGTGLGLSISMGDAHLHRGDIQVWSEVGEGTNFVLTLPRGEEALDGPSPVALEPEDSLADLGAVTSPAEVWQLLREVRGDEK